MSTLTETEKRYLEKIWGMDCGYVLDYSNATLGEFFQALGSKLMVQIIKCTALPKPEKCEHFRRINCQLIGVFSFNE